MGKTWNYIDKIVLVNISIVFIKIYSIIKKCFPKTCRFYPTCSQYSIEAIKSKGFVKGVVLSIKRILKCHPFHDGGYDPVDKNAAHFYSTEE
jgi:uncharacterized protein